MNAIEKYYNLKLELEAQQAEARKQCSIHLTNGRELDKALKEMREFTTNNLEAWIQSNQEGSHSRYDRADWNGVKGVRKIEGVKLEKSYYHGKNTYTIFIECEYKGHFENKYGKVNFTHSHHTNKVKAISLAKSLAKQGNIKFTYEEVK